MNRGKAKANQVCSGTSQSFTSNSRRFQRPYIVFFRLSETTRKTVLKTGLSPERISEQPL